MSRQDAFTCKRTQSRRRRFELLEDRLCLSSINGYVWHDLNNNGIRESFVIGDEPDVVMAIDESGSTLTNYFGRVGISGQASGVDENWDTVACSGFVDPVIIVSPVSYEDSDPAVARVKVNYDAQGAPSSFDIRVDEWEYLDGNHGDETLNYLVIEAGQHKLDDGTIIEAGTIEVDSDGGWVSFDESFASAPILLTQVMTNNETDAVTTRVSNLSLAGFNVTLQEEEASNGEHATETVAYVAITPTDTGQAGSGETFDGISSKLTFQAGTASVDSSWNSTTYQSGRFSSTPLVFASMQTTNGSNPAALRYQNASSTGVALTAQEETSYDPETTHATETVDFLAVEGGEIWVDVARRRGDESKSLHLVASIRLIASSPAEAMLAA